MNVNDAIVAIYLQTKILPTYADFAKIFNQGRQAVSMAAGRESKLSGDKISLLENYYKVDLKNFTFGKSVDDNVLTVKLKRNQVLRVEYED